jgi:hypothetical protein
MAVIRNRERNFTRYLERHFGLALPEELDIFYAKGVRVGTRDIKKSRIRGELGYAACDFGFNPTNSFIQNFGHLAKKNILRLDYEDAMSFAAGKDLKMDLGKRSKHIIVNYKRFVLGLGHYDAGKGTVMNRIPKKRARAIVNEI